MNRGQFISAVEGTQRELRRFLVALCCGDSQLADDIAQETYIKAYMACDDVSGVDKFKAWIFRIGYNTFIDNRRSARNFNSYEEAREIPANESADSRFRYQDLYDALNRLPAKERTSVLLYYMEGYSVKEIAAIVEASEGAVKQHLSRGRNHLRGILTIDN